MKLEKEQRTQFIALCVLLVGVVGFGAYRMMGTGTSADSRTATPTAAAQKATADGHAPASPVEEQKSLEETAKVAGFVQPVKDPFEPQVLPGDIEAVTATKPTPAPRLPVIVRESRMPLPVMPSFDSQPLPVVPQPAVEEVNPTKYLRLTGVIEGDTNIAIIRAGDTRHIVREGQSIDGKFVVRSISRTGVRLSYNGRSYFLTMASSKDT